MPHGTGRKARPRGIAPKCPRRAGDDVNISFTDTFIACRAMKILVIEDDADIASNIGQYFEDRGHRMDFAGWFS